MGSGRAGRAPWVSRAAWGDPLFVPDCSQTKFTPRVFLSSYASAALVR